MSGFKGLKVDDLVVPMPTMEEIFSAFKLIPKRIKVNRHPREWQDEYGQAGSSIQGPLGSLKDQKREWATPLISQQEMEVTHCKRCGEKYCMHPRNERS